jgi:anaerobic ribonucleoside-triphosphate reductase activating protein
METKLTRRSFLGAGLTGAALALAACGGSNNGGGDAAPAEVDEIAANIRRRHPRLHTAWWSGRSLLSKAVQLSNFDYIKLGPYLAHLGPLKSRRTNQRLYKVVGGTLHDITSRFWQHT